ncbi:MAG: hypothetical protein JWO83_955 [Caulobacteraceae bacterium]|jgi:hypothetical protein|nr:hypothetical protein [Caulobacteraceae bacterium]
MKFRLGLTAGAMALAVLSAGTAGAQAVPRNWERGPVTMIQQIEVKPGQFNAYMQDLAKGWRMQMEEGKRAGAILAYSIEQPVDPRAGEPNLVLVTVFKDMASVNRPLAEGEKSTAALYGSLDQAHDMQMKRESMRTIKGSLLLQGIEFIK